MKQTTMIYKGVTIQFLLSGWYSAKSEKLGYLKADTLQGIKKLIDSEKKIEANGYEFDEE